MDNNTLSLNVRPFWAAIFINCYSIIMVVVFSVGIMGNLLVIYVVGRFSCMQTVTNIYLMSLAIADTLYLLSIPFVIFNMTNQMGFTIGIFFCKLFWFLSTVNWFAGTFTLTALSADRYLAILYPLVTKRFRTPFYTTIAVVLLWLLAICLMVPAIINAKVQGEEGSRLSCISGTLQMVVFTMYTFTFGYLVPCILIIFFYARVVYRLKTVGPVKKSKEKKESQRKTTRLVLAVILVYVLCWLPYWCHQLGLLPSWKLVTPPKNDLVGESNATSDNETIFVTQPIKPYRIFLAFGFQILGYINSAANPVLYSFLSLNFRKSFKKVFTCTIFSINNAPTEGETRENTNRNGFYANRPQQSHIKASDLVTEDIRMVTYQTTFGGVQSVGPEEVVELLNTTSVLLERESFQTPTETAID